MAGGKGGHGHWRRGAGADPLPTLTDPEASWQTPPLTHLESGPALARVRKGDELGDPQAAAQCRHACVAAGRDWVEEKRAAVRPAVTSWETGAAAGCGRCNFAHLCVSAAWRVARKSGSSAAWKRMAVWSGSWEAMGDRARRRQPSDGAKAGAGRRRQASVMCAPLQALAGGELECWGARGVVVRGGAGLGGAAAPGLLRGGA